MLNFFCNIYKPNLSEAFYFQEATNNIFAQSQVQRQKLVFPDFFGTP